MTSVNITPPSPPEITIKGKYTDRGMGLGPTEVKKAKNILLALPTNNKNQVAVPVFKEQKKGGHLLGIALIPKAVISNIEEGGKMNRLKRKQDFISATFVETNPDGDFSSSGPRFKRLDVKDLLNPPLFAKDVFDSVVNDDKLSVENVTKQQIKSQKAEARNVQQVILQPHNPIIPGNNVATEGTDHQNQMYQIAAEEALKANGNIVSLVADLTNGSTDPKLNAILNNQSELEGIINDALYRIVDKTQGYNGQENMKMLTENQAQALRESLNVFSQQVDEAKNLIRAKFPDAKFSDDPIPAPTVSIADSGTDVQNSNYGKAVNKLEIYNTQLDKFENSLTGMSEAELNQAKENLAKYLKNINTAESKKVKLVNIKKVISENATNQLLSDAQAQELSGSVNDLEKRFADIDKNIDQLIADAKSTPVTPPPPSPTTITVTPVTSDDDVDGSSTPVTPPPPPPLPVTPTVTTTVTPVTSDPVADFATAIEPELTILNTDSSSLEERMEAIVQLAQKLSSAPNGFDFKDQAFGDTIDNGTKPVMDEVLRIMKKFTDAGNNPAALEDSEKTFAGKAKGPYKGAMEVIDALRNS